MIDVSIIFTFMLPTVISWFPFEVQQKGSSSCFDWIGVKLLVDGNKNENHEKFKSQNGSFKLRPSKLAHLFYFKGKVSLHDLTLMVFGWNLLFYIDSCWAKFPIASPKSPEIAHRWDSAFSTLPSPFSSMEFIASRFTSS